MSRLATLTAATALVFATLSVPTAASAAPIHAEDPVSSSCVVAGGELQWGVKESFRSYISGSIANGEWTAADGATYETPLFSWANPVGEVDAETGAGTISFTGSVHFSGHEGVLNLLIANPKIVLNGDGTAQLLLDTKSNDAQGELVIDEQQVYLGKVEGFGATDPASGSITLAEAPAVLTADGAKAFSGFYSSGDELDPVTLSLQLRPCAGDAAAAPSDGADGAEEIVPITAEASENNVPWLPIIIGGVALIVIGVTTGMLIAGRKRGAGGPEAGAGAESEAGTAE